MCSRKAQKRADTRELFEVIEILFGVDRVRFSLKQLASYLSTVKNDSRDYSFRLHNEAKWRAHRGGESGYGLELKFHHSVKLMLENSWFLATFGIQVLWLR